MAVRVGFEPGGVMGKAQVIDSTNARNSENAFKSYLITILLRSVSDIRAALIAHHSPP